MPTLSFNPSESLDEAVRLYFQQQKSKDPSVTLSQILAELVEKSLNNWDIILLIEHNRELKLSLEAEAKRVSERYPPIYR